MVAKIARLRISISLELTSLRFDFSLRRSYFSTKRLRRPSDPPLRKATAEGETAGDTPAATGNAQHRYSRKRDAYATFEVSMHRNRLMMSVDWFAHLPIRARKLAHLFELVHSSGFNSSSIVGTPFAPRSMLRVSRHLRLLCDSLGKPNGLNLPKLQARGL